MKIILLSLTTVFLSVSVFSQSLDYYWLSKGEIPKCIKESQVLFPKYTVYPLSHGSNYSKKSNNLIFDRILSSGRVLFGDKLAVDLRTNCAPLFDKGIFKQTDQIYILKSSVSAIVSNQDIYLVTTGLLAQTSSVEQLFFLLIREKEKQLKSSPCGDKVLFTSSLLDDLIKSYYRLSLSFETSIDEKALQTYSTAGFSAFEAVRTMDVLRFSHLPFEDVALVENYFGSTVYVPKSFYDVSDYKGVVKTVNPFGVTTPNDPYQIRKDKLLSKTGVADKEEKAQLLNYIRLRYLARLQVIEELLIANEFEKALYSVGVLEKEMVLPAENYLVRMKLNAWYGMVVQNFSLGAKRYEKNLIQNNLSESDRFFRLLNKLNGFAVASLALRFSTDVMNQYPELYVDAKLIRDEITNVLVESNRFPIKRFSKETFPNSSKEISLSDTISKYDKIDMAKKIEVLTIDSNEFYFYAIPDLLSDSVFVAKFDKDSNLENDKKTIMIDPTVSLFTRKGLKENKSLELEKLTQTSSVDALKKYEYSVTYWDPNGTNTATLEYNRTSEINQMILQKFKTGETNVGLLGVSQYRLQESFGSQNQQLLFCQFTNRFKMKARGVHFLGFLILPLPWVATDLLIRGNQSNYLAFNFNSTQGKILDFEQIELSYSWNKNTTLAQLMKYITNIK